MKFENTRVYNFESAFRGMRNPKNSWQLSDSQFGYGDWDWIEEPCNDVAYLWAAKDVEYNYDAIEDENVESYSDWLWDNGVRVLDEHVLEYNIIGPKDMRLAKALISGGSEHRKFLRQINVSVDITAPLYWWKEFDTYKVGTTANSTSTMHKLTSNPITIDSFEIDDFYNIEYPEDTQRKDLKYPIDPDFVQMCFIPYLEYLRQEYLRYEEILTNDMDKATGKYYRELQKRVWKELVRWLPESWLQTRTVTLNYENILSMIHQRKYHKLNEWSGKDNYDLNNFIKWARSLPYADDLLFGGEEINLQSN